MHRFGRITTSALSGLIVGLSVLSSSAVAQTAKDLVGTWSLVTISIQQGEQKIEPYGPNPIGSQIFESNGRFSIIVVRAGVPKFVSNNRETGTAEENKAAVQGSMAFFGSYTANDADKLIALKIEGASYPNFTGQDQTRVFEFSGDQLITTNPTPSAGGGKARTVWKRVK